MASSRELEHQVETERSQIAETLNRLRERMSPGQLADQAVEYARRHGGVDFARNLGKQAKANPIPVVMMAVGIGWLMLGSPPARRAYAPSIVPDAEFDAERSALDQQFDELARDRTAEVTDAARSAEDAAGRARDTMSSTYDAAGRAGSLARDAVSSAYGAAAGAVGRTTDVVRGGAASMSRRAHHAGEFASEVGQSTVRNARYAGRSIAEQAGRAQSTIAWLAREQPLVLGAIGLAIGALVGAGVPRTRREDEVMGEASDRLRGSAKEQAREQFSQAREAGGRVADKVRGEAERQGFAKESAQEKISDIGEKVAAVAGALREGAEDEFTSAKDAVEDGEKPERSGEKPERSDEHASGEGTEKTQVREAAGSKRYSEADPSYLPEGSAQPTGQDIKAADRVG